MSEDPNVRLEAVDVFIDHMASQDPERLEADRAEAWRAERAVDKGLDALFRNGNRLPGGPHFVHCYIYEGQHCSCGGNYQGANPGPTLDVAAVVSAAARATEK